MQIVRGHDADDIFHKSIQNVTNYLTKQRTRPDLQEAILSCLQKWRCGQNIELDDYNEDLQEAIIQQHEIGWFDLLEGLPTKTWQRLQQQYYKEEGYRCSSKRWIRGLLVQLHHLVWNQWEHCNEIKHRVAKLLFKQAE